MGFSTLPLTFQELRPHLFFVFFSLAFLINYITFRLNLPQKDMQKNWAQKPRFIEVEVPKRSEPMSIYPYLLFCLFASICMV